MKTLAIETSGGIGGIAAWADGRVLAEQTFSQPMNHAQELFPAVEALARRVGWEPRTPELIAVSIGPGSYTGLRVGIASAKMLSYASDVPLIGVPTFDVLIRNVPASCGVAAPVMDAKRAQVYVAFYQWADGEWREEQGLSVDAPEAAAQHLPRGTTVFGTGAEKRPQLFTAAGMLVSHDPELARAKPRTVAEIGHALYVSGHRTDREALVPIYLRKPEAEEKRVK